MLLDFGLLWVKDSEIKWSVIKQPRDSLNYL